MSPVIIYNNDLKYVHFQFKINLKEPIDSYKHITLCIYKYEEL